MSNLAEEFERKINAEAVQEAEVVPRAVPRAVEALNTVSQTMTPEAEQAMEILRNRRETSLKKYPSVSVDDDEYVVLSLSRHAIGIYAIVASAAAMFVLVVSAWILLVFSPNNLGLTAAMKGNLSLIFAPLSLLTILAGVIGYSTYNSNKLTITNERAIQLIVRGLLHRKKQVINLESVEDISFTQTGVFQHMFNYGTLKLSTVGEESTYTFVMVGRPAKLAEIVGEVCEAAKNKRILEENIYSEASRLSQ